ncbi:hypothetical protein GCM10023081_47090 [Arthrobacter ginkgonis]|uniref:Helix-turn-helix DNA binding domain protein n=1 Tax=Arthrobacter ginkgonis TaxID=1630594 RepID=A0ABP7DKZ1_9MICC
MARVYAQTDVGIWSDDDFLDLGLHAQWLYWHLFSQPDLSYCGVTDWRPKRIVPKAAGLTLGTVLDAARELCERHYIVTDEDTEEVLVRSFVRSDGLLKQRNMGAAVAKAHATIASRTLAGVVVHELQRLHAEHPDWSSWSALESVLSKRSINPYELTSEKGPDDPPEMPFGNPSGNPFGKGSPNPFGNPSGKGSGKASDDPPF